MSNSILHASSQPSAPTVSVSLEIAPSTYSLTQSTELPALRVNVTSHADQPITVFTFPSILNPQLALMRNNFYCKDLGEDGAHVWLNRTRGPNRPPFRRQLGHNDERYFLELQPEQPVTITCPFTLAADWKHRDTRRSESSAHGGVEYRNFLEPGHSYEFGLQEGNRVPWWRYGTKSENLEPSNASPTQTALGLVQDNPILFGQTATTIEILG